MSDNRESEILKFERYRDLNYQQLASFADPKGPNDPVAQNAMGVRLMTGRDVDSNHVEGVQWLRRAADQGFPPALMNLSTAYLRGAGVAQDLARGLRLYVEALCNPKTASYPKSSGHLLAPIFEGATATRFGDDFSISLRDRKPRSVIRISVSGKNGVDPA